MPPELTPITAGFALLVLVGLPVITGFDARNEAAILEAAHHRRRVYVSAGLSQLVVALLTLGVAAWQDVPAESLGWTVPDTGVALLWGLGVTVGGLGLVWAITRTARAVGLEESMAARLLLPRDTAEKRAFLLLSGVAAVGEEYVFRGFALSVLASWTGSPWAAAALVSLSFGLSHGYQRLAGVLRAGALGLLLAAVTIWTGSLFPAIVGHFWMNAAIGLGGWRYLFSDNEPPNVDAAGIDPRDANEGIDPRDANEEGEGKG